MTSTTTSADHYDDARISLVRGQRFRTRYSQRWLIFLRYVVSENDAWIEAKDDNKAFRTAYPENVTRIEKLKKGQAPPEARPTPSVISKKKMRTRRKAS